MKVSQGDIWFADFGLPSGREQGGERPALVVSNDAYNTARFGLFIAVPLTTSDRGWVSHIRVDPGGGAGLRVPSWAMVEQAGVMSARRFMFHIGAAPRQTLGRVLDMLHDML